MTKKNYTFISAMSLEDSRQPFAFFSFRLKEDIDQIGIARLLDLDRTTTGLAIKNLQKNDLVTRERDPKDRRSLLIKITPKAKRQMAGIQEWALGAHTRNVSKLTKQEQKTLQYLLKKIAD